jgi:hypothetical protein
MRVFRGDAAEIVPHASDDRLDPVGRELWQGGAEIPLGSVGNAEARSDPPGQSATEPRGGIERHRSHRGKK